MFQFPFLLWHQAERKSHPDHHHLHLRRDTASPPPPQLGFWKITYQFSVNVAKGLGDVLAILRCGTATDQRA